MCIEDGVSILDHVDGQYSWVIISQTHVVLGNGMIWNSLLTLPSLVLLQIRLLMPNKNSGALPEIYQNQSNGSW